MSFPFIWHWMQMYHIWLAWGLVVLTGLGVGWYGADSVRKLRRDARVRAKLGKQPPIYEIGSAEHNAQIVGAVRQINERLAADGKRVPERAAMDIIYMEQDEARRQSDERT